MKKYLNKIIRNSIFFTLNFFPRILIMEVFLKFLKTSAIPPNQSVPVIFNNDWVSKNIMIFGIYERNELMNLKFYLNPDDVILDVGANIGNHSFFFSKFVKEVHSFEPVDSIFKILQLNVGNLNNVKTYNFGLSNENENSNFKIDTNNFGSSSSSANFDSCELVNLFNYDSLDFFKGLKIDFVKLDIEGMELEALSGMIEMLKKFKPKIAFEYDRSTNIKVFNFLKNYDYNYFIDLSTNKPCKNFTIKSNMILALID